VSVKENIRLIESMMASYNARDWIKLAETYAESAVFYEPGVKPYSGRDAILGGYQALHSEFPDEQIKKVRSFGQGDWACVEMVASGTNKGPLMSPDGNIIPPTNKSYQVEIVAAVRFENGKIAEYHEYFDRLGMLSQLGLYRTTAPRKRP
jgi:ketosteroid isomerase-like protein